MASSQCTVLGGGLGQGVRDTAVTQQIPVERGSETQRSQPHPAPRGYVKIKWGVLLTEGTPEAALGPDSARKLEPLGGLGLSEPLGRHQTPIRCLSLKAPGRGVGTELILGKHLFPLSWAVW